MKKISFLIAAATLTSISGAFAQAQTQSETLNQTSYLKNARLQLEKDNEQKILEQLEAQRLQEEKVRLQKIESMSFSSANVAQPAAAPAAVPVQL